MKKLITTLIAALILSSSIYAQPPDTLWTRTYSASDSDDAADCVRQTIGGGYILSGRSHQNPSGFECRIYLIKTNERGDTLWTRNYWRGLNDDADCIVQTANRGYITTGHSTISSVAYDIYWLELDDRGYRIDSNLHGSPHPDEGHCIQATLDGNYAISGYNRFLNSSYNDATLIKIDPHGDIIWEKSYTGPDHESARWFYPTSDGGYILGATTESYGAGSGDAYLIKTNANGDSLWSRTFGGRNYEEIHCIQQTSDGGYILAGHTNSTPNGDLDVYLIRTDSAGDSIWTRTFGGAGDDRGYGVLQAMDGEYIVVGRTDSWGAGGSDAYIIKVDDAGNRVWQKTLGGRDDDNAQKVIQGKAGNYIICGKTCLGEGGGKNAWLICLESDMDRGAPSKWVSAGVLLPGEMSTISGFPETCALHTPHPNPFNASTVLSFELRAASCVKLAVYDVMGREVARLLDDRQSAGMHQVIFDAASLPSGIYFARLQSNGLTQTQKLLLLK